MDCKLTQNFGDRRDLEQVVGALFCKGSLCTGYSCIKSCNTCLIEPAIHLVKDIDLKLWRVIEAQTAGYSQDTRHSNALLLEPYS